MEAGCKKCNGAGGLAAEMKTFEYEGRVLSCIVFVSSCTICGHCWEDLRYKEINLRHVERACFVADRRLSQPRESSESIELGRRNPIES